MKWARVSFCRLNSLVLVSPQFNVLIDVFLFVYAFLINKRLLSSLGSIASELNIIDQLARINQPAGSELRFSNGAPLLR